MAPYAFIRGTDKDLKTENPTVFNLATDGTIMNERFSFPMVICKLKNEVFQSDDKQPNTVCELKQFPCGMLNILKFQSSYVIFL